MRRPCFPAGVPASHDWRVRAETKTGAGSSSDSPEPRRAKIASSCVVVTRTWKRSARVRSDRSGSTKTTTRSTEVSARRCSWSRRRPGSLRSVAARRSSKARRDRGKDRQASTKASPTKRSNRPTISRWTIAPSSARNQLLRVGVNLEPQHRDLGLAARGKLERRHLEPAAARAAAQLSPPVRYGCFVGQAVARAACDRAPDRDGPAQGGQGLLQGRANSRSLSRLLVRKCSRTAGLTRQKTIRPPLFCDRRRIGMKSPRDDPLLG